MEAFIKLDRVSLSLPIYLQRERRVRNWAGMFFGAAFDPPRRQMVRLLDEVSFEAKEGDRVAILGRNGAGKSTLLRVLNGVYRPTSGQVQVVGRCQALLNMSLGFNGEATVRENIFLRGTAMRLKASDLGEQIDPILDFAGLHDKANHRLRTLSAGQKMRLGFAISTSFQQDVILMDEWVGAGDADFMAKATERMRSRVGGSKIVMLASHSVGLLRDICNKGIVLEQGKLLFAGDIIPALSFYHELMASLREQMIRPAHELGDAGHTVYGCAENISFQGDMLQVRGWATSVNGAVPQGLALETAGVRHVAASILRQDRVDVARHFGLTDGKCGFLASFNLPHARTLADLGGDLQVLAGAAAGRADTALRLAPAVSFALSNAKASVAHPHI